MKEKCYAAVDLGGTTIYGIVALSGGKVLARGRVRTLSDAKAERVIAQIAELVRNLCDEARAGRPLSGVGLCAAGFFDADGGIMVGSPNISGLNNVPLGKMVRKVLGAPAVVENDANAAALGEYFFGAGQGSDTMIFVTASTGIGGGIVHRGTLFRGSRGMAGEIGHIFIMPGGPECGCGNRGCLEAVASGTAIARKGAEALYEGRAPVLQELCPDGKVTAEQVFKAAEKGDEAASRILEEAIFYLGTGLAAVTNLLNPDRIVIGGGLSRAGRLFLDPLEQRIKECAVPPAAEAVSIRQAALGEEAGVWGMLSLLDSELA